MQNFNFDTTDYQTGFYGIAQKLIADRKAWQEHAYKTSNEELYTLLARCLHFYRAVADDAGLFDALTTLYESRGFKANANTSLPLRIVRLVFAEPATLAQSKHRLFTYTRVLSIAKEQGITEKTLADFIIKKGGIDEIRRNGSISNSKQNETKQHREVANSQLSSDEFKPLFKLPSLPKQLQPKEGQRFSLALVRKNADGTASIVFGTAKTALVHSVLADAGKSLQSEVTKVAAQQQADAAASRQDANLKKFEEQVHESFQSEVTFEANPALVAEAIL